MEELKAILGMLKDVPDAALIVLGGYLFFKLFVIGSTYAVIRLIIVKAHNWATTPKDVLVNKTYEIDKFLITGEFDFLMSQLKRLPGKGIRIETTYIHRESIEWLQKAITNQEKLDRKEREEEK